MELKICIEYMEGECNCIIKIQSNMQMFQYADVSQATLGQDVCISGLGHF